MAQAVEHQHAFDKFNHHLREDRPDQVNDWAREYANWDSNPKGSPCIFDTKDPGMCICNRANIVTDTVYTGIRHHNGPG